VAKPTPASPESTIEALLRRSKREFVPIRRTFVQQGEHGKWRPGPLADFVHSHDERGLKLYLLFLSMASCEPWDVTLPAGVWARATGIGSVAGVSKVWKRLADRKLVSRGRSGRKAEITALREDSSGEPYCHPGVSKDRYFRLPFAFWTAEQRWYRTLDLSETAVLLIGLSLSDRFLLPSEKARPWYGLSSDTVEHGLRGLHHYGLLRIERESKPAPLTALGYTLERRYTLLPPFGVRSSTAASSDSFEATLADIFGLADAQATQPAPTTKAVAEVVAG
jgi:hypothetical protein